MRRLAALDERNELPTTVYIAARACRADWVGGLTACLPGVISTWPSWTPNVEGRDATQSEWAQHSSVCLNQSGSAQIVLFVWEPGAFGGVMEAAACLQSDGECWLVADEELPFLRHHPRCRSFKTIADAVTALVAQQNGHALREKGE
jgi:hypothetical protein